MKGGQVTGKSWCNPGSEIFHTDTDELSFLPSSIVNNAPIQLHQRPYINGLFRMVIIYDINMLVLKKDISSQLYSLVFLSFKKKELYF